MARQRKPKPEAVILPPEYDDVDEDTGSVLPDDDGWITLESADGNVTASGGDPVAGKAKRQSKAGNVARKAGRRGPRNPG